MRPRDKRGLFQTFNTTACKTQQKACSILNYLNNNPQTLLLYFLYVRKKSSLQKHTQSVPVFFWGPTYTAWKKLHRLHIMHLQESRAAGITQHELTKSLWTGQYHMANCNGHRLLPFLLNYRQKSHLAFLLKEAVLLYCKSNYRKSNFFFP